MNNTAGTATKPGFPFRRFALDARFATLLNVGAAAIITVVTGRLADFPVNLTYSLCIGSIAFALIDSVRLVLCSHNRRLRWFYYAPLLLGCGAIAQYAGSALASVALGFPVPSPSSLVYGTPARMMMVTLAATACITLFFVSRERALAAEAAAAEQKARAESVERQALQTQLQLLQAQIEPHMLFNTLANVQGMIAIDADGAQRMLDQLIQYLRATLTSSRARSTTLGQEFALMDAYLGLMSVRMGARLAYTLDLPEALRGAALPPMLLQPLVENAIIHGLEPKIDGGHVSVSARRAEGLLVVAVSDTGLGLDGAPAKPGTRLGIANTRERLSALFGAAASLTLEANHPAGARALLTLPVTAP